jgi:hypothetical protein
VRKDKLTLLAVLALGLVGALSIAGFAPRGNSINSPTTPYPTVGSSSPSPVVSATPSASGNIEVLIPRVSDEVESGFTVRGNARVFENVVSIRLSDDQGNVLVQTTAYANAPDTGQFGPFEKMLEYDTDASKGVLEVYQASAKDGSEIDKVTIPLLLN